MSKYLFAWMVSLSFALTGIAQSGRTIRGKVTDGNHIPLTNLTIGLASEHMPDTLRKLSGPEGTFSFFHVPDSVFTLTAAGIGYTPFVKNYRFAGDQTLMTLDSIVMSPAATALPSVTIIADKSIILKEDTVEYAADSFKTKPNATVEDLLKKLPGVQVDKNGNVTAQGKTVSKVKVDGKDFFGGDTRTATQQLPANMIDKVQVIDDYGDQANFTGVKDGDPQKIINLQIKKNRNTGYFGHATLGAGTDDRYQASAAAFKFAGDQQISLLADLNNTNSSAFNFSLPGLGNSSGSSGGVSGPGSSGSSSSGSTASSNGLIDNKSVGLNYRDQWGKKLSEYGNYNFLHRNTVTQSSTSQQNIFATGTNVNNQTSRQNASGLNYRVNENLEDRLDSADYVKFSPTVAYNTNHTVTLTHSTVLTDTVKSNEGIQQNASDVTSPNYSGSLLLTHRFKRQGRTFSANLSASYTDTRQTDHNNSSTTYYQPSGGSFLKTQDEQIRQDNTHSSYGASLSYTERLNPIHNLEMNYSFNRQYLRNEKHTYARDSSSGSLTPVDSLSNDYENTYTTHRMGLNIRTTQRKYYYSLGLVFQPSVINSYSPTLKMSYSQRPFNYFPVARFVYTFSRTRSAEINYSGSTNEPTYTQLQPVVDNSNQLYVTQGNPDLRPELNHSLNLRYNNFDIGKGDVLFSNLSLTTTRDKIVNNTLNKGKGVQETQYLNANGYYSASVFNFFAHSFGHQRFRLNINGTASYNHNISFIDSFQNIGKNWVINQSAALDVTLKGWLEGGVTLQYGLNSNRYSIHSQQATSATTYTIGNNARIDLPGKWIMHYDIEKTFNLGFTSSGTTDPFIINAYVEKQLFRKIAGSVRLQAFDLLDQNNAVSRTVSANAIIDSRTNILGRYYMLSFRIRLAKFGGKLSSLPDPGLLPR